jgi:mono/diheme cytochrome c family protein
MKQRLKVGSIILAIIILLGLIFSSAYDFVGLNPTPQPNLAPLLGNEDIPPPPPLDPQQVAQGQGLYNQYCAACHGLNGAGQPDWKIPNDDGSFKPPPHDISGHTWHHDDDLLLEIVTQGSDFPQSQMPTFGDQLTDDEVKAILEYIKSWWGPEERAFQWQVTWQASQQK